MSEFRASSLADPGRSEPSRAEPPSRRAGEPSFGFASGFVGWVRVRVQLLVGEDIKWLVQRGRRGGGGGLLRLWIRRSHAPKFARTRVATPSIHAQASPHINQRLSSFGRIRACGWSVILLLTHHPLIYLVKPEWRLFPRVQDDHHVTAEVYKCDCVACSPINAKWCEIRT